MSFLVIARERYPLRIGENTLGGRGAGTIAAPALAGLPPFAVITVVPGTPTSIRSAGALPVRVEGYVLGAEPCQLSHGARIEVRGCRVRYGELSLVESTSSMIGIDDDQISAIPPVLPERELTNDFAAHLIDLDRGAVYGVPESGLHIGRDPVCQVVLASTSVSRHHALIAPARGGWIITDRSTNGVQVNGVKVHGSQPVANGDVIRIGEHEYRFDAMAPEAEVDENTPPPRIALAHLVTEAKSAETFPSFTVERPVVHIGRGTHNDLQIADESVSASHATLLRRGAFWHLIDLASTNGTFVDGERVEIECLVQGGQQLRFGEIAFVFRPTGRTGETGTQQAAPDLPEPRRTGTG